MIFKIIATTFLAICATGNRMLPPTHGLIQAPLPDQRFYNRHTQKSFRFHEPIDYHYSTANSILRPGPLIPNTYQRIQYAPLHGRIGQKNKNTAAEYTKVPPTLSSPLVTQTESNQQPNSRNPFRKAHLEPRVPTGPAVAETFKCFSPGHKIEVLSSVSRSPGHNAVYRSFPEAVPRDKPYKFNYMRPYGMYQNLEALSTTMVPFELPDENMAKPFIFSNRHYVLNPNNIPGENPVVDKIKRQFSPYSKYHRLHLNIARVYSPGQAPVKSPVFADTYSQNFGRSPVHSLAYIPPGYQPLPDHKTLLYPTKENVKKYRFRLA